MSRDKGRRGAKMPVCLTCLISCAVTLVVLVVAIIIGANVAFNKYVSPKIGGVTLSECNKLFRGLFKSNRDKIVTNEYTQQDLDDFYRSLNAMLYQKEKTVDELREEYDELPENQKSNTTFETYCASVHKYRITVDSIIKATGLAEMIGEQKNEENTDELAAAEEETTEETTGNDQQLVDLFKQLSFDFTPLADYPYMSETEDYSYTTFQVETNQVAALIGELFPKVLSMMDTSSTPIGDLDISSYIKLPQILTSYALKEGEPDREKSLKLSLTVELFLSDLIQDAVAPILEEQGINATIVGFAKKLLPKKLFVTMEIMPLDETKEATVKINNYDDKQAENLKKIVNALTESSNIELMPSNNDETAEDSEENKTVENKSLFLQINEIVCNTFTKINDYAPVQFVPKGESATLRLAHIQALLTAMQLFDPEDLENSVTPHLFLTTLRCLIDVSAVDDSNVEELDSLYKQLSDNYGIDSSYWDDHTLLDTSSLSDLPSKLSLNDVKYKNADKQVRTNENMRVFLREGQVTTLLTDGAKNGLFNLGGSEETAAAEDESAPDLMKTLSFDKFVIKKQSSGNVENYAYTVDDENRVLPNGTYDIYSLNARVSLSIVNLLGGENSSEALSALSKTLPDKLSVSLNLKIKDIFDSEGNLVVRTVGGEAGDTAFEINKFNEEYTDKVFNVFKLMIEKLSGSSDFGVDKITDGIENGFSTVFSTIKDNLYCNVLFTDKDNLGNNVGCMTLPSIYELAHGLTSAKIKSDDSLTEEDNLTIDEFKEVFVTLYDTDIAILDKGAEGPEDPSLYAKILYRFDPDAVDGFLNDLSGKYYLKETIEKEKIFGEGGLEDIVSVEKVNFKGMTKDGVLVKGLYTDLDRSLSDLRVPMNGDQLCSLINSSGSLSDFGSSEEFLKSLEIINCDKEWKSGKLYLNVEFSAVLSISESGEDESFDVNNLLPEKVLITARILLYADDYAEEERFSCELLINTANTDKIAKLINLVSSGSFDSSNITSTVGNSVGGAFENIEANINLVFIQGYEGIMQIDTVFNTINKLSNKNDPSYVSDWVDDGKLKNELQEFGRQPAFTTKNVVYKESDVAVINSVDILQKYFNAGLGEVNVYSPYDSDEFLDELNLNFYIKEENKLTVDNIKSMDSVSADIINFDLMYNDEREYEELETNLTNNRFTALANNFYENGFDVTFDDEGTDVNIGKASIIQTRIYADKIELVIRFSLNFEGDNADKKDALPDYFFITTYTSLLEDEHNVKNYDTEIVINSLSEPDDTEDLFVRISLLSDVLNMSLDINSDDIKKAVSDNVKEIFDNYLVMFGELEISESNINLPNFFEYLSNGKLDKDGEGKGFYNKDEKMKEKDGITLTSPQTLRYRLKEMGKKDKLFISELDHGMTVWKDGLPYDVYEGTDAALYYNDNEFLTSDADYFYDNMKAFYFLNSKPNKDTFSKDNVSILDNLTGDLSGTFNLYGDSSIDSIPSPSTLADYAINYTRYGLHNYNGLQINPTLSDKALGAIIKEQNAIDCSTVKNVEAVEIKSVKINVVDDNHTTIEITLKVTTKNLSYMPEYFYLTSFTIRESISSEPSYTTTLTVNRFTEDDFDEFKANINHLFTFDLISELENTDSIAEKINDALKELFDNKLKDYMQSFNNYSSVERANNLGFGYVEFKNVYSVIVDKSISDPALIPANAAELMQKIIVKIHNVNTRVLANKYSDVEKSYYESNLLALATQTDYTDKELAYYMNYSSGINVIQAVIFKGENANYADFLNILKASIPDFTEYTDSGFANNKPYIMFTDYIDLTDVSCNVGLLPSNIYGSVLFDEDSNVIGTFFNDLTKEEYDLFMLLVQDDNNDLDIEQQLTDSLNDFKGFDSWTYSQSTDFSSYYGIISRVP